MVSEAGAGRRAWGAVERWLFAEQPVHALVIGRIVFGLALFGCYAVRAPDAAMLYGADGLAGGEAIQRLVDSGTLLQRLYDAAGARWPAPDALLLSLLYAVALACALCFAAGYRTRTTGWIVWAIHLYFYKLRLPLAYWGWPALMQAYMAYVLLSRAGDYCSVDAWLKRKREGSELPAVASWRAPAWPLRLLQVHVSAMYSVVGISRLDSSGWIAGHTIFTAVTTALHSKLVIDWAPFQPLLKAATWIVYPLEPAAVVGLWLPRVGAYFAYALLAMHFGLELLTNVGWWGFAVAPGLLAFVPARHLEAVFRRVGAGP